MKTSEIASPKQRQRQRPGSACQECRRRKLRCDGQQPQCETCFQSGAQCVPIVIHAQRGPKKGHVKALEAQLATMKQRLSEQQQKDSLSPQADNIGLLDGTSPDKVFELNRSESPTSLPMPPHPTDLLISPALNPPASLFIPDLLHSELDQLYFERTHPFVPFLNQHQYLSQSRQPAKRESQACLQHAMWMIASASSAQLEYIRDSIYECTRRMLDSLEAQNSNVGFTDIEHVQARILLLIYEFKRTNQQRAWISAGRCFRLVQLMRLYEIDSPVNATKRKRAVEPEDWVETEVKRRTFWVAYSFDRFISTRHEWPLTLNEQDISTRLPAPEEEFQRGQRVEIGFLSEAVTSMDMARASPFTESIISATICGRTLSHRQQSVVEQVYSNGPQQFWERHEWLYTMLKTRYDNFRRQYPSTVQHTNCMLLFTNMMAHTTVLNLCRIIESIPWKTYEYSSTILEFKQESLLAAKEIVNLTQSLSHLSYFKVHPFTPLPLAICVDYLKTHRYLDESVDQQVEKILEALRELTNVNNLAQDYLL